MGRVVITWGRQLITMSIQVFHVALAQLMMSGMVPSCVEGFTSRK